jgi:hypothetical protein
MLEWEESPVGLRALLLILALAPVSAWADTISFSDGIFDSAEWTGTIFTLGPTGGTASGSQILTGGNPDEYRQVQATINPTAGTGRNGSASLYSIYALAIYAPASIGAIESIDFSIDTFQTSSASGGTVTAALLQDGVLFTGARGLAGPEMDWTNKAISGLVQSEFLEIDSTGRAVGNPDFSRSGSSITLGFRYVISTPINGAGGSRTAGFDNWTITVNFVPEPTMTSLVLLGVSGLGVLRRHRAGNAAHAG